MSFLQYKYQYVHTYCYLLTYQTANDKVLLKNTRGEETENRPLSPWHLRRLNILLAADTILSEFRKERTGNAYLPVLFKDIKPKMKKEESQKRRLFKKNAREVVKHHYFVLMMLCLVAIYFGSEFRYVTSQTNDTYSFLTGREIEGTDLAFMIDDNSVLETALEKIGVDTSAMKESSFSRCWLPPYLVRGSSMIHCSTDFSASPGWL